MTVRYEVDEHGHQTPVEIERILVSTQHADGCDAQTLIKPDLIEHVLQPILPRELYDEQRLGDRDFVYVNPTGKFVIGGPMGDTGLTGRKIIVDTYGGAARHGGGAFSGKDPTKVDRSAAYAARYVAKNVVAAGLADRCEVQRRLRHRRRAPGLGRRADVRHRARARAARSRSCPRALRPAAGRDHRDLDLRRPIYAKTAAYGHFGRDDPDFTWERTDKAAALREAAGVDRLRRPSAEAADKRRPGAHAALLEDVARWCSTCSSSKSRSQISVAQPFGDSAATCRSRSVSLAPPKAAAAGRAPVAGQPRASSRRPEAEPSRSSSSRARSSRSRASALAARRRSAMPSRGRCGRAERSRLVGVMRQCGFELAIERSRRASRPRQRRLSESACGPAPFASPLLVEVDRKPGRTRPDCRPLASASTSSAPTIQAPPLTSRGPGSESAP